MQRLWQRHRLHPQHSGNGRGNGDNHLQDGFPSILAYLHNFFVFKFITIP